MSAQILLTLHIATFVQIFPPPAMVHIHIVHLDHNLRYTDVDYNTGCEKY